MNLPAIAVLLFALFLSPCARSQDELAFTDPAPPAVNELPAIPASPPTDFVELTFHRAAKPLSPQAVVEDSPGFLGPRREGISRETMLLHEWSEGGPALVWSMQRGEGYASPAIQGRHVVFPHRVEGEIHVDCLEAETGRRFWRFSYPTDYRGRYIPDSGPRATPLIANGLVFVHGVEGQLLCLELTTGRLVWQRDLKAEFDLVDGFFGVVSSPIAHGDLLIVNTGAPGGPTVAAFEQRTGRLVWGAGRLWGASCSSPILGEIGGSLRLCVLTGGDSRPATGGLMVLDPSTGALQYEYPFRSRTYESVNGATPVLAGQRVILTAAYSTGTAALEYGAEGFFELWKNRRFGIEFATPLFVDGYLHAVDGVRERAGAIACLDPATGEEVARTDIDWEEDVVYQGEAKRQSFSIGNGSLLHADGDFLCLGDYGHLLWLTCGPDGAEVRARAALFRASESWTPLVLSRGLLYVCQNRRERFGKNPEEPRLLCYDLRRR